MRSSGRFVVAFGGYLSLLVGTILLLAGIMPLPGFVATKILAGAVAIALLAALWRQTQRTNIAVARFVSALDHGDLAQTFRQLGQGTGFDQLGAALDTALRRLREDRIADAADNRFAAALVDEAPTPLLAIDPVGIVQLSNKRARRLFGGWDGRHIAEFAHYGTSFSSALDLIAPGERRMCRVAVAGVSERATLACAGVDRGGALWRIVSVQVIQSELDAAEIATQSDLVRVLTHEIMNSVTPVTSLAASAAALMASIDTGADDGVTDARLAVEALGRRAAGIMHFVDSYREFSTAPAVTVTRFAARTWLDEIARLFAATPHAAGVSLDVQVVPEWLEIAADADLLAQVLLNLLKNGAEAMLDQQDRRLSIAISSTAQGRTRIVVDDNGPGILDKVATDIFLPFFTTKRAGTGVGLSFARQIVLLHHGSIEVGRSENSGARFDLIL
jgi:two-component system nitrogen regulation sensor histidine kinase NtrY